MTKDTATALRPAQNKVAETQEAYQRARDTYNRAHTAWEEAIGPLALRGCPSHGKLRTAFYKARGDLYKAALQLNKVWIAYNDAMNEEARIRRLNQ